MTSKSGLLDHSAASSRDDAHGSEPTRSMIANSAEHSTSTFSCSSAGNPDDDLLCSNGLHRSNAFHDLSLLRSIELASQHLGKMKRSPEATNLSEILHSEGAVHVLTPSASTASLDRLCESPIVRFSSSEGLDDDLPSPSINIAQTPRITRRISIDLIRKVTSAKMLMDFHQFQRFVLLSYALRHNLVERSVPASIRDLDCEIYSPRVDLDPSILFSPEDDKECVGIFLCGQSKETLDDFKSHLWAPDDMEDFVDTQNLDDLERALDQTPADIGIYVIEVTESDFEHVQKEFGHKHVSGRGTGKTTVCGCYIERKCKGWRLLEQKFGDRAFCVLVQDSRMKKFFSLHADLPADVLPTYDVGHIVMWPRDRMVRLDYKKLLRNVEDELPYTWPHDVLCSASQWKRIVFESQLQQLIRITQLHSTSKRRLSLQKLKQEKTTCKQEESGFGSCIIC